MTQIKPGAERGLSCAVPIWYTVLLVASRKALRTGVHTSLSRATAFLADDYKPMAFWWEPLEMCRKLALTVPPLVVELRSVALAAD